MTNRTVLWEEGGNTESVLQIRIQQRKEDQRDTAEPGRAHEGDVLLKGEGNSRVKLSSRAEKLKGKKEGTGRSTCNLSSVPRQEDHEFKASPDCTVFPG